MQDHDTAEDHRAAPLKPPIVCDLPEDVSSVEALPGHRIRVRFHDGVEGIVDLGQRVRSPRAGVFAALADPAVFGLVHIEMGAVSWPGGVDLAPDAMHDELVKNGEWVLS